MAHYAKPLSFLLLVLLVSLEHIEARESKFFSKVTHNSNNIVSVSEPPLLAPAPAPASPAPAPLMSMTEFGYGLYGHGSTETTTTTSTTNANDENEVPMEELNNVESYKESNTGYSYNNDNNNNNGYTSNSYGNDGYESSQKQGMSDTRYVENGRYYYNVQNENYYNNNGYESSVKESTGNTNGGYNYGTNGVTSNEFNTMEEYERQQGYPQGEYVP